MILGLRRFAAEAGAEAWVALAATLGALAAAVLAVHGLLADGALALVGLATVARTLAVVGGASAALWAAWRVRAWWTAGEVLHGGGDDLRSTALHEAGHVVLAEAEGCTDVRARITSNTTGHTRFRWPVDPSPRTIIAVAVAGEYASNDSAGCGTDRSDARRAASSVPWSQRDRERSAGRARARKVLAAEAGRVRKIADRLERSRRY